jgi:hypothetical protein
VPPVEPTGVSLSRLGLIAPDGLACPEGGAHEVLEPELQIAAGDGGGHVLCLKCHRRIYLCDPKEL